MPQKIFLGQSATVIGLGLHGGGASVARWLVKHGAKVTVTDLKTKKELQQSIDKLSGKSQIANRKIEYILGKHRDIDFIKADLVVQNPGVPRESKYIKIAQKAEIPVENEASLFFKYCQGQIIGVTGTRGKSTTATLIYSLLKQARRKVWLAGLPGKPMMDILDKVKEGELVVLELSSWQLEVLGQQTLSPEMAVVTNIYPDHLNRYKSMSSYISAKENIFKYQNTSDVVFLNAKNLVTKKMAQKAIATKILFSTSKFKSPKLLGQHNDSNIAAAVAIAKYCRVSDTDIKQALQNFSGLPGRLEIVRKAQGVIYINDTTSTTPDATIAALNSHNTSKVILIAGGDTKNIPQVKFKELSGLIKKKCKAVVLFVGPGSKNLTQELKNYQPIVTGVKNMTEAVGLAQSFAKSGDTVLLSPACASFNLFVNEFDRGDQFNQVVKQL